MIRHNQGWEDQLVSRILVFYNNCGSDKFKNIARPYPPWTCNAGLYARKDTALPTFLPSPEKALTLPQAWLISTCHWHPSAYQQPVCDSCRHLLVNHLISCQPCGQLKRHGWRYRRYSQMRLLSRHCACISFLIQGKLMELNFLSSQLIHSWDHGLWYFDEKNWKRNDFSQITSKTHELCHRPGELVEILLFSSYWKTQGCGRTYVFWGTACRPQLNQAFQ